MIFKSDISISFHLKPANELFPDVNIFQKLIKHSEDHKIKKVSINEETTYGLYLNGSIKRLGGL